MSNQYGPLPGGKLFDALRDQDCIIMATNIRIAKGVAEGLFQAAKDADAAFMVELAKSECDLEGGYTGFTPGLFSRMMHETAEKVGFDAWALHADHLTVKTGSEEEVEEMKRLIATQIGAGYTSYAIDASFLYDEYASDTRGHLAKNIEVTSELAHFIKAECQIENFGLEVEVGEIGKKNDQGMVITSPEEATTFIQALHDKGVEPHAIAVANGSTHGFIYDKEGNRIEQVSIDIDQTKAIVADLKKMDSPVRIAQHGITGTPRELIATRFPKGDITKGNVGTFWMALVWDQFQQTESELYKKIFDWVIENYGEKAAKKNITRPEQIFDKFSKQAIKPFFDEIYAVGPETEEALRQKTYEEALAFFDSFNASGSASKVRELI